MASARRSTEREWMERSGRLRTCLMSKGYMHRAPVTVRVQPDWCSQTHCTYSIGWTSSKAGRVGPSHANEKGSVVGLGKSVVSLKPEDWMGPRRSLAHFRFNVTVIGPLG